MCTVDDTKKISLSAKNCDVKGTGARLELQIYNPRESLKQVYWESLNVCVCSLKGLLTERSVHRKVCWTSWGAGRQKPDGRALSVGLRTWTLVTQQEGTGLRKERGRTNLREVGSNRTYTELVLKRGSGCGLNLEKPDSHPSPPCTNRKALCHTWHSFPVKPLGLSFSLGLPFTSEANLIFLFWTLTKVCGREGTVA